MTNQEFLDDIERRAVSAREHEVDYFSIGADEVVRLGKLYGGDLASFTSFRQGMEVRIAIQAVTYSRERLVSDVTKALTR